jgi:catechol 2,3-dioxygenase-like lactoylglutathione lyase family enzyme
MAETIKKFDKDKVCQIGMVVRDIEQTSRAYAELFGVPVPQWFMTDELEKAHTNYRGKASTARAKLAFFQLGPSMSLELIEPVGGPSTWQEFLDTKGEGVHHIAFNVSGMQDQVAFLKEKKMPLVQTGDYTGGRYAYIDGIGTLKVILELLENF